MTKITRNLPNNSFQAILNALGATDTNPFATMNQVAEITWDTDSVGTGTGMEPLPDITDIKLAYDESSRVIQISTSDLYSYWIKGKKVTVTSDVDNSSNPLNDESGAHYIYFKEDGTLGHITDESKIRDIIYGIDPDDSTKGIVLIAIVVLGTGTPKESLVVGYEGHTALRNRAWHYVKHITEGCKYGYGLQCEVAGVVGGTENEDIQVTLTEGTIFDEDLQIDIKHTDSTTPSGNFQQRLFAETEGILAAWIPIYYKEGSFWTKDEATQYPIKWDGIEPTYNDITGGIGSQVELSGAESSYMYIAATTDVNQPIILIQGQDIESNINDAEQSALDNLANLTLEGLPFAELKILYILVFTENNANTQRKATIEKITDIRKNSYSVL